MEHIIREDYLVEAMEILELYCDLLLARFGLIQSMKELDSGLAESVSTLIWAAPRLQSEVAELKIVADQLCAKYSKEYGKLCRTNQIGTVNDRLMHKLSVEAPPKILVERYLIEIAKNYNVPYEPDSVVMAEAPPGVETDLIDVGFTDDVKKGGSGRGGGVGSQHQLGDLMERCQCLCPCPCHLQVLLSRTRFQRDHRISMDCQWELIRPFPIFIHLRFQQLPHRMNLLMTLMLIRMSLRRSLVPDPSQKLLQRPLPGPWIPMTTLYCQNCHLCQTPYQLHLLVPTPQHLRILTLMIFPGDLKS